MLVCATLGGIRPVQAQPASAGSAPGAASPAEREWGPVQVVIYKSKRQLQVYRYGKFFKRYPVVLGFKPEGRKRFVHDARTPEGYYHLVDIRPHPRWRYFLTFDYPNAQDRRIYTEELARGEIPVLDGEALSIGGSVGIHGSDKPEKQLHGVDWTKGCIAMDSEDVTELRLLVEVGTPVWLLE